MPVPGIPFPVNVPVAHSDRKPEGLEANVFTYKPATEYDEHLVGIDLVTAQKLVNGFIDSFAGLSSAGVLIP